MHQIKVNRKAQSSTMYLLDDTTLRHYTFPIDFLGAAHLEWRRHFAQKYHVSCSSLPPVASLAENETMAIPFSSHVLVLLSPGRNGWHDIQLKCPND